MKKKKKKWCFVSLSLSEMSGNCSTSTCISLNHCISAIFCVYFTVFFFLLSTPVSAWRNVLGFIMYSSAYLWRVDLPFHSVLPPMFILFLLPWTLIHDFNVPYWIEWVFLCRLGWKRHSWPWFIIILFVMFSWVYHFEGNKTPFWGWVVSNTRFSIFLRLF